MIELEKIIISQTKMGKNLTLTVSKSDATNRIYVKFSSSDGKFIVEKNFQADSVVGITESEKYQTKFKSIRDFKNYLGLKEK